MARIFQRLLMLAWFATGLLALPHPRLGLDSNGNRTNQTVRRTTAVVVVVNDLTSYQYDSQNRLVATIDPDGLTNQVVYHSLGKQAATIDKLGRTTSYSYDNQGNLPQTIYPDGSAGQGTGRTRPTRSGG